MIIDLINKQIELERQNKEREGYFYVTDAAACKRKVFYDFKKDIPKTDVDTSVLRKFVQGNSIHEKLVAILEKAGVVTAKEINIPANDYKIHGRVDAMLEINGEKIILEIKSIANYGFISLKEPKREHVYQLQLYLFFFNIKKGYLLYESKDNQNLQQFEVRLNINTVKRALKNILAIEDYLKNDIIPPRDFLKNSWQCKSCPYKNHCWIN